MSTSNFLGFAEVEKYMRAYKEGLKEAEPVGAYVTNSYGVLVVPGHCAETTKEAIEEVKDRALAFASIVGVLYPDMAKKSSDYAYMAEVLEKVRDRLKDIDYLVNESAEVIIGDPDDCVRQVKKFADLGVEEILLDMDGIPHDKIMKSLELFGKYVIPHFRKISAYP